MNTGDLYSGMTSGSFGTSKAVKKQRKAIKLAKEELTTAILPAYKQVIEDIDEDIERLADVRNIVTGGYTTEDEVRFELAVRSRMITLLNARKARYASTRKVVSDE